jgi:hypothetical protein
VTDQTADPAGAEHTPEVPAPAPRTSPESTPTATGTSTTTTGSTETAMASAPVASAAAEPSPKPRDRSPGPPPTTGDRVRYALFLLLRAVAMLAAFVAMVAFAVSLAQLTLTPVPGAVGETHANLRPGWSLRLYLDFPARDALRQVGGNIVLGVPFGVLLPILFPGVRGFIKVSLITALVMLAVELAQGTIVTGRAFDIDDVILNTTGALLGFFLIGRRISRGLHRRRPRSAAS